MKERIMISIILTLTIIFLWYLFFTWQNTKKDQKKTKTKGEKTMTEKQNQDKFGNPVNGMQNAASMAKEGGYCPTSYIDECAECQQLIEDNTPKFRFRCKQFCSKECIKQFQQRKKKTKGIISVDDLPVFVTGFFLGFMLGGLGVILAATNC